MSVDVDLLRQELAERVNAIDEALAAEFGGGTPRYLHEAGHHLVAAGGKRIRPVILLLFAEALDADGTHEDRLPAAMAIELVHTLSLIHDDIVDDDALRRGVPSVHVAWDRPTGIVAGDLLYARAFELVQATDAPAEARLASSEALARACQRLCEGQARDMALPGADTVTEQEYLQAVKDKTGALFAAAAEIGTILGGGDERVAEAATTFGRSLGTAFQLRDDVLDLTGSPDLLGKPIGSDLETGKMTLVTVHAQRNGVDVSPSRLAHEDLEAVRAELREAGSLDYVQDLADRQTERALAALEALPQVPAREVLADVTRYAVERDR